MTKDKQWIKYYINDAYEGIRSKIIPGKSYHIVDIHEDYRCWCKEYSIQPYTTYLLEKALLESNGKAEKSRLANKRKGVYRILVNNNDNNDESEKNKIKVYCGKCLWFKDDNKCTILKVRSNHRSSVNLDKIYGKPIYMNRYNNCKLYVFNKKR